MTNLQLLKSYGEVKKRKYKNATIYYHASIEDPKRERDETMVCLRFLLRESLL